MPNAPKPEREFCPSCGFPARGPRCEACGGGREPLRLEGGRAAPPASAVEDVAGLEGAFDAVRSRDMVRFVEQVLRADANGTARSTTGIGGPGWIAVIGGSVLFVWLQMADGSLVVEAPVVRLPQRQRVPVLRLALELCGQETIASRFCLREDLLLLRYAAPVMRLEPPLLRRVLREVGHHAARAAELFAVGFEARSAIPEERRGVVGFEVLGEPKAIEFAGRASATPGRARLAELPPLDSRRTTAPEIAPDTKRVNSGKVPARPWPAPHRDGANEGAAAASMSDDLPPILAPELAASVNTAVAPAVALDRKRTAPSIPPLPMAPDPRLVAASSPHVKMAAVEPGRRLSGVNAGPPAAAPAPIAPAPLDAQRSSPTTGQRRTTVPIPDIDLEAPTRRTGNSAEFTILPADRLCALLRQAQQLAAVVLQERPAIMPWLVRSTAFRAIYEYSDALPDAVAHLYRCTGMAREVGNPRASNPMLGPIEPALPVMERIIAARAQIAREKPLAVEPLSTAQQAKEHVGRYVIEIERAPGEPVLRHFLALGALTELLVRTKLPGPTEQRLREIVAHAQREGPKAPAIELMMTSLQRIIA